MMTKYTFDSLMRATFTLKEREIRPMRSDDADGDEESEFQIAEIVIPKIQRDYAQGRSGDAESVREDFVQALYEALHDDNDGSRCSLNFIYGQLRKATGLRKVSFVPLDGQQRLTTLFLLHWYLSRLENRAEDIPYLSSFRYDIRYSSSEFSTMFLRDVRCLTLDEQDVLWLASKGVQTKPGEIVPQGWMARWLQNKPGFTDCWLEDPTIVGMLAMLETIHDQFSGTRAEGMLDKLLRTDLESAPIYFFFNHVEPSADDGEMFIKMNSRGKLLTEYEYFKADFQRLMKKSKVPVSTRLDTAQKLDGKWEPSFWRLVCKHGEAVGLDPVDLDTQLMRYVNYVIDVLGFAYRNRNSNGEVSSVLDAPCEDGRRYSRKRLERLLLDESQGIVSERLETFLLFLDAWTEDEDTYKDSAFQYFADTFCTSANRDPAKITVFAPRTNCQMLLSVLAGDLRLTEEGAVLLFAATVARISNVSKSEAEFRLRTVRNLLCKMDRQEQDMPYVYDRVFHLMVDGKIDNAEVSDVGGKTFTVDQVREEVFKSRIADSEPEFLAKMRDLEESEWFKGSISALLPLDYDAQDDVPGMAATFAARKVKFEKTFGALGASAIPDALMRDVLFWACQKPYCISARNSWYHWGTGTGDFRWRGDDRPYLSRNDLAVRSALLSILDGKELDEVFDASPNIRGKAALEELRKLLKLDLEKDEQPMYDAAYYMSRYYDLFFELSDHQYKGNLARMKAIDSSLRVVNFYHRKNRSNAYWDPYLYVMWKISGIKSEVTRIVNPGGTSGVSAYFPTQNVQVQHCLDQFLVWCSDAQVGEMKQSYPDLICGDVDEESGLIPVSIVIPRCEDNPDKDSVDRIKAGSDLFKVIDSLSKTQQMKANNNDDNS